jgi:putative ABC transport system permease protein
MTTMSILHALSGDPIPQKSQRLFQLSLIYRDQPTSRVLNFEDAQSLLTWVSKEDSAVALAQGFGDIHAFADIAPEHSVLVRYTTRQFFALFDAPFLHGGPWGKTQDADGDHVAVITEKLATTMFRGSKAIDQSISYGGATFRVVGILSSWAVLPKFYDLSAGAYAPSDDVYIPIRAVAGLNSKAFVAYSCDSDTDPGLFENVNMLRSPCLWASVWMQSANRENVKRYQNWLTSFTKQPEQRNRAGSAVTGYRLESVAAVLANAQVIPGSLRIYSTMGFFFLGLCIVSAMSTLLGKFSAQASEIGIRRALGASRLHVVFQLLAESMLLGFAGSIIGFLLSLLGLAFVRRMPIAYLKLATTDGTMLLVTICISIACGLLAGALPALNVSRLDPAKLMRG